MGENTEQDNSEYAHFLRSVYASIKIIYLFVNILLFISFGVETKFKSLFKSLKISLVQNL